MTSFDAHKMLSMAQLLLTEQRVKPLFGLIARTSITLTEAHDVLLLLPGRKEGWLLAAQGKLEQRENPRTFPPRAITEQQAPWSLLQTATAEGTPVQVEDPLTKDVYCRDPYFKANAIRDALAQPLRWGGRLQAMLYLERGAGAAAFSEQQLRQLGSMSGHMAYALASLDQAHYTDSRFQDLEAEIHDKDRALAASKRQAAVELADAVASARAKFTGGVLHQLGNEINSIALLTDMIDEQVRESRIHKLTKANDMLEANQQQLTAFLTEDPKGKLLPKYLLELGKELVREHADWCEDLTRLREQVALVKDVLDKEREKTRQDMDLETMDAAAMVAELFQVESARLPFGGVALEQPQGATAPLVRGPRVPTLFVLKYLIKKVVEALEPKPVNERSLIMRLTPSNDGRTMLSLMAADQEPPTTAIASLLPTNPAHADRAFFQQLTDAITALHRAGADILVPKGNGFDRFALLFPPARL